MWKFGRFSRRKTSAQDRKGARRIHKQADANSVYGRQPERRSPALRIGVMGFCVIALWALVSLLAPIGGASPVAFARQGRQLTHHDASGASLNIIQPTPQNTTVEGPVGANVTVQALNATAGDSYQLGYSSQDQGCASSFNAIGSAQPVAADTNGSFTETFTWPADANSVGVSYYICAQDQTNTSNQVVQSSEVFHVDASQAPAITVLALNANGTPEPTQNSLVAGGQAQISGQNFWPAGINLYVFLTPHQFTAADNVPGNSLKKTDGTPISSDGGGNVAATVTIPSNAQPGNYYLTVVSADGSTSALPTLVSNGVAVTLGSAPTPTPTMAPSPTATPTGTGSTGNSNSSGPGAGAIVALIGLSGLSIILFIMGVVLLVSAAAVPRPGA